LRIFAIDFLTMKYFFLSIFLTLNFICLSQIDNQINDTVKKKSLRIDRSKDKPKAKFDQYRIISLNNDTTYVDTTLTIQKLYKFNYLRKDIFGLLPFANEGQTYNTLNYGLTNNSVFPEIGFRAKSFSYSRAEDINYYSVATPITDLYYKSVMEQGQNLQALITVNLSERLNLSISYRGLRSIGKYINQLSSTGNFTFTSSYATKNKKYNANFHFTKDDISNGENGGATNINDFESGASNFKDRPRIAVNQNDAKSLLQGMRFFLTHSYRINSKSKDNYLDVFHQINYEDQFFEFNQVTVDASLKSKNAQFGDSYKPATIIDSTFYNKLYNKIGLSFKKEKLGKVSFFVEDFRNNTFYKKVLIFNNNTVPSLLSNKIVTFGGNYEYNKNNYSGNITISKAITNLTVSSIDANLKYQLNKNNIFNFQYQNISKQPNNNFSLYQSSYKNYNWSNNFNNEKINTIKLIANTKYVNATIQLTNLNDYLYFSNDIDTLQLISPKQFASAMNYLSFQANKEFKFGKFALDNTLLFQEVKQDAKILNLPIITTRNTIYYSNFFFKRALFLQTGVTLNYFTKYFANDFNPVTGEFFVQKAKKVGAFPMIDLFVNGRIRQTRIFFIAEHVNTLFTKSNYLTAPNYPYRDFMIRFGLVWNFFQ
jgi:Putative porin